MNIIQITFDLSGITNFSIIVAIAGYVTVFFALLLLYTVFNNIPKLINYRTKQRLKRAGKKGGDEDTHVVGEVNAAISMAIYLYFNELHDEESHTMTIKRVSKRYSPWSSKVYNLNPYSRITRYRK